VQRRAPHPGDLAAAHPRLRAKTAAADPQWQLVLSPGADSKARKHSRHVDQDRTVEEVERRKLWGVAPVVDHVLGHSTAPRDPSGSPGRCPRRRSRPSKACSTHSAVSCGEIPSPGMLLVESKHSQRALFLHPNPSNFVTASSGSHLLVSAKHFGERYGCCRARAQGRHGPRPLNTTACITNANSDDNPDDSCMPNNGRDCSKMFPVVPAHAFRLVLGMWRHLRSPRCERGFLLCFLTKAPRGLPIRRLNAYAD
jgi:hypothetical protein